MRLNGKEFPVHRAILAPVSLYFDQMLSSEWEEGKRRCIDVSIEGVTETEFDWVLRNTYGEESKALGKNQIQGVLKVASYFQLEPLIERIGDMICKVILTASELLALGITHSGVLDRVSEVIQIDECDVEQMLKVATAVGATKMQHRCGVAMAEKLLTKDTDINTLAQFPVPALLGCFSSDHMAGLPNEDALFELIYDLCQQEQYTSDVELDFASCVRLQFLSVYGIERASRWPAIDRNALIAALAKQRDPNAFSEVAKEKMRRFYVAFSKELSRGTLTFDHDCNEVTHTSKTRAVAVVDTPCERGKVVRVTFVLRNDKKGDEGTCFGVTSRFEVGSVDYREAEGPLWRAYNGEIRENRTVRSEIEKVHPGDIATIHIDGILKRVEFIKGGKSLATRDCIPDHAWPLCPAVWFYGNNEKVMVQNTASG
eukprot:TRINITY_DN1367_c0_g1_i3.p1 TRINITY_DN1367_c0_g1~~TRINITY_DN1367_c0_g1_i3.p1  ORF type:complete len:428 (+),score=119.92 TRINITY_DN1367_c0_g1_i3:370-1653(+)